MTSLITCKQFSQEGLPGEMPDEFDSSTLSRMSSITYNSIVVKCDTRKRQLGAHHVRILTTADTADTGDTEDTADTGDTSDTSDTGDTATGARAGGRRRQVRATPSSCSAAPRSSVGRRLPHDRVAALSSVTPHVGGSMRPQEQSAMTTTTKALGASAAVTPSSAGACLPPPPFKLSYIDFPPRCAGAGNVICAPDYERFDVLVARANEWLQKHPHLRAKSCESIEVKGRYDGIVDTNKSCYYEADHSKRRMRNLYIRAIRLWIVPKEDGDPPECQQIGYVNVVPGRNEFGVFDGFGDTVRKFNQHLRIHPLPGKILNIESQEMKFHEWGVGVDPDESCWVESVKFNVSFLVVIRIFYEVGTAACEEIGCADFVPSNLDPGSQFAVPMFECFNEVIRKASSWVRHQHRVRITNVQSIDYKLKHDYEAEELDTQRSFFVESGRYTTKYLRILRVCFVHPFDGREVSPSNEPPLLNYVTFEPVMLSSGGIIGIPLFEKISETMKRAMSWLNRTAPEVRVISAETVPVRMFSGNQYGNHEVTYTWNRGEQKEFWLLVLRLYLSGTFDDMPPPDVILPPFLSKKGANSCCAMM